VSSASRICEPSAPLHTLIGDIPHVLISDCNNAERPSAIKRKRKGYIGSPCLKLLVGENASNRPPLNFTDIVHYPLYPPVIEAHLMHYFL
jgi:hypothetical protein